MRNQCLSKRRHVNRGFITSDNAGDDLMPILVRPDEITNVQRAAHAVGKSEKTVRRWFKEHRIGRQATPNSPLEVHIVAAHMVASGDFTALELLRNGNRAHPRVQRYYDHLGIQI